MAAPRTSLVVLLSLLALCLVAAACSSNNPAPEQGATTEAPDTVPVNPTGPPVDTVAPPPADPTAVGLNGWAPAFVVTGSIESGDQNGLSAMAPSDLNDDQALDIITSATTEADTGGRVDVFLGPFDGSDRVEADFVFDAAAPGDRLGTQMAHGGTCDVNGDGTHDLVVGAGQADVAPDSGEGAPDTTAPTTTTPDTTTSDTTAPDTTVAASDPEQPVPDNNRGVAYVAFGSPAINGNFDASRIGIDRASDVTLLGVDDNDLAGSAVACLGDIDGDGYSDIAVGAYLARSDRVSEGGAVYLIYGGDELEPEINLADADAIFVGADAVTQLGFTVAGTDLNGDRLGDIVIGAPLADAGGASRGAVHVMVSSAQRFSGTVDVTTEGVTFAGTTDGQRAGYSVSPAGDVNGDGTFDLLVGSASVEPSAPGTAWIVYGADELASGDLGQNGVTITGLPGDLLGTGLTAVGDSNNNGFADFVLGAPGADDPEEVLETPGMVYAWAGADDLPAELTTEDADWSQVGLDHQSQFGATVVPAGDLNSDGRVDLLVAAPTADLRSPEGGVGSLDLDPDTSIDRVGVVHVLFGASGGGGGIAV
jgi:hypothetical protein